MRLSSLAGLVSCVLVLQLMAGCGIPKAVHQATLRDLAKCRTELADTQHAKSQTEATLNRKIAGLQHKIHTLDATKADLQSKLSDAQGNLSMYQSKTGGLQHALKATKAELAELRKARAQTEKRLKVYRDLAKRLSSMIRSGQLSVKIRHGKMVIQLADNILFDPGQTRIKKNGKQALSQLADVLKQIAKRDFLVAGYTDNVPIHTARFHSNWALSTARAVKVVELLQKAGVDPHQLAAAGYGQYDPVASNDTKQGRKLNRRIEIILMPDIKELPQIPKNFLHSS